MNRVRTDLVRVASSELLSGQVGLLAYQDIDEGTVIACFGALRELRQRSENKRTLLGYSFTVKESGGRTVAFAPCQGVTDGCMAHAINHTEIANAPLGGGGREVEGVVGGRRICGIFVKTTRRVAKDTEFFANYGTEFLFGGGCVCHTCRPCDT